MPVSEATLQSYVSIITGYGFPIEELFYLLNNIRTHEGIQFMIKEPAMLLQIAQNEVAKEKASKDDPKLIKMLDKLIRMQYTLILEQCLDPWTRSQRSDSEQDSFKDELINYYNCASPSNSTTIKCMITGKYFSIDHVTAAHIWMHYTHGVGLEFFGMKKEDVRSPRNGLLLHSAIEKRFDHKEVCFLWDPFKVAIYIKVLNPELMEKAVVGNVKFRDIDGNRLLLPNGKWPFRRILNWHARKSYSAAIHLGWVPANELMLDYFELSDKSVLQCDTFEPVCRDQSKAGRCQFELYDKVKAVWKQDQKYYFAKISSIPKRGKCEVIFDIDGSRQSTSLTKIRYCT